MKRVFWTLVHTLMAVITHAQSGQVPIFANKKDSVEYAQLDKALNAIAEKASQAQNFGTIDSTFIARRKFLEGKQFVYRWVFQQDKNFTPYQVLSTIKNKDSITRISIIGKSSTKIPRSIYRYKNLSDVELIDFKITRLPRRLKVKRVILYNNFASKPLKLSKNKTIQALVIRGDEQGMLPKRYDKLRDLQVLILARNNLKTFPNIEGCTKLNTINLNNNKVESIDPAIAKLTALENLLLYNNNIKEIPDEIYTMTWLRSVDLYFNHIARISPAIVSWKNLEVLYLANNEIYTIPNELGELRNLKELYLHHNKLSNLPASIGNLTSLYTLRINNNNMIEWPMGLSNLKNLTNFDCSFNQFESLPINDLDFRNMKILSIGGNPWDPKLKPSLLAWVHSLRENETVVHLDNNLLRK